MTNKIPPLIESGEPLVSASLYPERILSRPQYFIQGLKGSVPESFLRLGVYERLVKAADRLPKGWKFVLLDCWRSPELQGELFRTISGEISREHPDLSPEEVERRARIFVAYPSVEPDRVSGHCTGGSVDLTLADDKGRALPMGSGFDETSERSYTDHYDGLPEGEEIRHNRGLLVDLMENEGFSNYPKEWWHFDYGNRNWAIRTGVDHCIYGFIRPEMRWR
ncbi:M15 family metallopeptidase [Dethiosulfovibrio salsuginis]|uniref:D-alanyl-D-alanine dipeptidase n=1 Tax=Dethiosulfovibrio salsuginis TaxID=561720 RepID=A0A1X7IGK3_9BACT|nr:M15 family metallopeptidase [Dethiosulfovibrio salsuginis]SMG13887.1 D-alanyl-D-alanine dipeptidase [Dethiosulfovibrio salsuginis]